MKANNKFLYNLIFQIKKPNGKWKDLKSLPTNGSSYEIGKNQQVYISKTKREFKQDLPKYDVRIIKRRVKI